MTKIKEAFDQPELVPKYLWNQLHSIKIRLLMRYYRLTSESYTEAYRKLMRYRIRNQGERKAVGSEKHGIGELQFNFLKDMGLNPYDKLLDLGCGSLRGGQYFIDYLNRGNYTGMDISREAIDAGKDLVDDRLMEEKEPEFYVNDDLTFKQDPGVHDYMIAQSVFTHVPAEDIKECLSNLDKVLASHGEFYATIFTDQDHDNAKNFVYTESELKEIAADLPVKVELISEDLYPHPRNQQMVKFTIKHD